MKLQITLDIINFVYIFILQLVYLWAYSKQT